MERKIKVTEKEYRNMKNAVERQRKAKRLIKDLWLLFCNVERSQGKNLVKK